MHFYGVFLDKKDYKCYCPKDRKTDVSMDVTFWPIFWVLLDNEFLIGGVYSGGGLLIHVPVEMELSCAPSSEGELSCAPSSDRELLEGNDGEGVSVDRVACEITHVYGRRPRLVTPDDSHAPSAPFTAPETSTPLQISGGIIPPPIHDDLSLLLGK